MITNAVVALALPALLSIQEPVRQQAQGTPEWRQSQIRLATASEARRAAAREKQEKALAEFEKRQNAMRQAARDLSGGADDRMDPSRIQREGEERRQRLEDEKRSGDRLDSLRRVVDPELLLPALLQRYSDLQRFMVENDSLLYEAKDWHNWADKTTDCFRSLDIPTRDARRGSAIKAAIMHYERVGRAARAQVEFETQRGKDLKAEFGLVDAEITATAPSAERPAPPQQAYARKAAAAPPSC